MCKDQYAVLIYVACVVAWLMVMLPAVFFLARAWAVRRDNLVDLMTDSVLDLYYKRFYPSKKIKTTRIEAFKQDFGLKYGRRWYVVPLLLLGVLSAWGLWGTAGTIKVWMGVAKNAYTIPDVALGAFLGGLTWVIYDQLARFRDRDFTSHDVYNGVFRLLIAVPLGSSLASFCAPALKVPIAFLLGAFPTSALFKIARRLGAKQFGLADDAVQNSGDSELEKLQSVRKETAERLCDEGISSIGALAWTDPIDLTIRTNLEFSFVVDCISQALLWIYTTDHTKDLYPFSLRGAQEVFTFLGELGSTDPTKAILKAEAEKTLEEAAKKVDVSKEAFHQTLLQVADDPSTKFLVEIWK